MNHNLFSKIIIWITFYFCFQKAFTHNSIKDPLVQNIISNLNGFLLDVAPELIEPYIFKKPECLKVYSLVSRDSNEFFYYAFDSGFLFSQIGKEDECINANKSYFFYNYTYPIDGLSKEISNQYCLFLQQTHYSKSLCLPKECHDFIYYLTNNIPNQLK